MASQDLLQQLGRLDSSSSGFHDQLSNILYGEDYARYMPGLQGNDLAWLADFLDNVRRRVPLLPPSSSYHRRSVFLILLPPLTGSVCANSNTYVAPGWYYRPRTPSRLQFSALVVNPSLREVPGISSKGPSTVRVFASNVLGRTPKRVLRKP